MPALTSSPNLKNVYWAKQPFLSNLNTDAYCLTSFIGIHGHLASKEDNAQGSCRKRRRLYDVESITSRCPRRQEMKSLPGTRKVKKRIAPGSDADGKASFPIYAFIVFVKLSQLKFWFANQFQFC